MIFCIGNSHAHFFSNSTPSRFGEGENGNEHFRTFSIGPVIAYNFYEHHFPAIIELVNQLPITSGDYISLIVGEVDCRWHLPAQADKQGRDVIDLTYECIDRFFRSYLYFIENGYKTIVWGGHPSTTRGHDDNPSEPIYGDCLSRNKISLCWNDHLEKLCKENNIPFVSIIRDLINVDGLTKMQYYKDYCHLDSEKLLPLVIEKFRQLGLL